MLRLVELGLFLAPFAAFAVWRFMASEGGPPLRLVVATACLLLVMLAGLVWFNREAALPPDSVYQPPHIENGRVVSGRGVPE